MRDAVRHTGLLKHSRCLVVVLHLLLDYRMGVVKIIYELEGLQCKQRARARSPSTAYEWHPHLRLPRARDRRAPENWKEIRYKAIQVD